MVFASAYAGVLISAEAILTFAGVGLQRPTQSWGILLFQAQARLIQAPHLLIFPSVFLVAAVLGFVLLGEASGGGVSGGTDRSLRPRRGLPGDRYSPTVRGEP